MKSYGSQIEFRLTSSKRFSSSNKKIRSNVQCRKLSPRIGEEIIPVRRLKMENSEERSKTREYEQETKSNKKRIFT